MSVERMIFDSKISVGMGRRKLNETDYIVIVFSVLAACSLFWVRGNFLYNPIYGFFWIILLVILVFYMDGFAFKQRYYYCKCEAEFSNSGITFFYHNLMEGEDLYTEVVHFPKHMINEICYDTRKHCFEISARFRQFRLYQSMIKLLKLSNYQFVSTYSLPVSNKKQRDELIKKFESYGVHVVKDKNHHTGDKVEEVYEV